MICCLCDQEVDVQPHGWAGGHNPEPLASGEDKRCCTACNETRVIPARLALLNNPGTKSVFIHAVFQPRQGNFKVKIERMTMELTVDQFMNMAIYFAQVGASYKEWLKNGGKL